MCWGRRSRDYWISCLINPSAGREFEWGGDRFTPAAVSKKVLVVGGGPAGLEAAPRGSGTWRQRYSYRSLPSVGGQFPACRSPSHGADKIIELIDWYETSAQAKLDVDVQLNCYVEAPEVAAYQADVVILATGSTSPETGFQKALPSVEVVAWN